MQYVSTEWLAAGRFGCFNVFLNPRAFSDTVLLVGMLVGWNGVKSVVDIGHSSSSCSHVSRTVACIMKSKNKVRSLL